MQIQFKKNRNKTVQFSDETISLYRKSFLKKEKKLPSSCNKLLRSQQDHRDTKIEGSTGFSGDGQLGQITNDSHAYLSHGSSPSTMPREVNEKREKKEETGGGFLRAEGLRSRKFPLSLQIFPGARGVANRSLIIYVREDVTIETRVEAFSGYGETFWPPKVATFAPSDPP